MNAKAESAEVICLATVRLLRALTSRERELVEDVRTQHPRLSVAEAIEALRAAGM